MIKVCCVCRKYERNGQWRKNNATTRTKVSHVYCPFCFDDLMDKVDQYAMQKWSKSVYTITEAGLF